MGTRFGTVDNVTLRLRVLILRSPRLFSACFAAHLQIHWPTIPSGPTLTHLLSDFFYLREDS